MILTKHRIMAFLQEIEKAGNDLAQSPGGQPLGCCTADTNHRGTTNTNLEAVPRLSPRSFTRWARRHRTLLGFDCSPGSP